MNINPLEYPNLHRLLEHIDDYSLANNSIPTVPDDQMIQLESRAALFSDDFEADRFVNGFREQIALCIKYNAWDLNAFLDMCQNTL